MSLKLSVVSIDMSLKPRGDLVRALSPSAGWAMWLLRHSTVPNTPSTVSLYKLTLTIGKALVLIW
jgi:hypothetical protein